jgi:hypothetical protein
MSDLSASLTCTNCLGPDSVRRLCDITGLFGARMAG